VGASAAVFSYFVVVTVMALRKAITQRRAVSFFCILPRQLIDLLCSVLEWNTGELGYMKESLSTWYSQQVAN
jgi:hypothetical protein